MPPASGQLISVAVNTATAIGRDNLVDVAAPPGNQLDTASSQYRLHIARHGTAYQSIETLLTNDSRPLQRIQIRDTDNLA
jgi:hypothetical protein